MTDASVLADEVLRYWLAVLRQEEALAARPRARKLEGASLQGMDVRKPAAGQQYAKLPTQGAESLLADGAGRVERPLSADWPAFFEDWLLARYRRGEEEGHAPELALFPTVHLPRDELAGVLRLPVELTWWCADRPFVVPSMAKRRRGEYPQPPTHVGIAAAERPSDESLPFFLDAQLLREVLRIDGERIDALFTSLRERQTLSARQMLWAVAQAIRAQVALERETEAEGERASGAADTEPDTLRFPDALPGPRPLLDQLTGVVAERLRQLGHRARVYDVALVVSGAHARTTWHLQRDIKAAREMLQADELKPRTPLGLYLGGGRAQAVGAPCRGRFAAPGLTPGQRDVCERALGSTLTAAQGPPGTGKTNLILSLFAHVLVNAVHTYVRTGRMGRGLAMVASTNNRAVDNATDPLGSELPHEALPVSLRVGSRQTIERVTVPQLERCVRWLSAQQLPPQQAQQRLEQAKDAFRRRWQALEPKWAPHAARLKRRKQAAELGEQLDELRHAEPDAAPQDLQAAAERLASGLDDPAQQADARARVARFVEAVRNDPERSRAPLDALVDRLEALSRLTERSDGGALVRTTRHWKRTQERHLRRAEALLGFTLAHGLPPTGPGASTTSEKLERWEEAGEDLLGRLLDVRAAWERLQTQRARAQKRRRVERELEQLEAQAQDEPAQAQPDAELEGEQHALFQEALRVREAWAIVERDRLLEALSHAIAVARESRSLKRLWDAAGGRKRDWLRQLFPAWGCTLLSLGNVLPSEQACVDWMVIDEAGQCHPAHAVSALLRAKRALVVGDVHQLEPVVGLGAGDERRILDGLRLRVPAAQLEPYRVHAESLASIQTLADRAVHERAILTDHFRCQPEIVAICEALCEVTPLEEAPMHAS